LQQQCEQLGLDIDQLLPPYEESSSDEDGEEFEVWPEHWQACRLFAACDDQWNVLIGSRAHYQGLRMEAVGAVADWLRIEKSDTLFWQLRILVREARSALNNKAV
jgi:hypothetical protein